MTRVIAGQYGGRRLQVPPGIGTRPTSERTREALFSALVSTHDLEGGPFIDLYAGSGAIGIEALSRGATSAVFVENDARAAAVIKANLDQLGLGGRSTVLATAAVSAPAALAGLAAMTLFADPPYDVSTEDLGAVIAAIVQAEGVHHDALLVVERSRRDKWVWPAELEGVRDRRYGDTHLWYGRAL